MTTVVPPFTQSTLVDLHVACSYDLHVVASRYFDALDGGEVPLEFLFSGTLFYTADDGRLQTVRLSWDLEASYPLPVAVWRETMDHHFPSAAWVRLSKPSFDRLCAYKARHALPTVDDALDVLLEGEE